MQDRYTGDVGDFGKYGLLRALRGNEPEHLRLGVIWYRTNRSIVEADPTGDGRHTSYLDSKNEPRFRGCDAPLYDALRGLVRNNDRRVAAIAKSGLLGVDTRFHETFVPVLRAGVRREEKLYARQKWMESALRSTHDCQVVFLDPDNGLEAESVPKTSSRAPKYAYLDEVKAIHRRRQSLVVYHHLSRQGTHREQVVGWRDRLQRELGHADIFALRFRRGTARAFFIVANGGHSLLLRERIEALVESPWGQSEHFELVQ